MRRLELVGQIFGLLTVKSFAGVSEHGHSLWACKCTCGGKIISRGNSLTAGAATSCGCSREKWMPGDILGTYELIKRMRPNKDQKRTYWLCKCLLCGTKVKKGDSTLAAKNTAGTKKCRCKRRKLNIKQGSKEHIIYAIYKSMLRRCNNPKDRAYKNYGGRGIKVCKKWREDFWAFYKDIGPRPSKDYSIDRVDNDGNYEPGNVKWSTREEQANNKRPKKKKGKV